MLLAYYSNHIWIDYLYPKKRFNLIYIVYSFFQKNNHIPLNKFIFHFKYRLKKYLNKIGIHKADRALMVPKMTYKEYSLFKNFLAENLGSLYLESGSGGSTLIAERIGLDYHAYETNAGYAEYMNALLGISKVNHIPVGETAKYGRPLKITKAHADLISGVFDDHIKANTYPNVIAFLDGRCRVLTSLKIHPLLKADDVVLVHDFHRSNYQDILEAYDLVNRVDNLAMLKKKKISEPKRVSLAKKHATDIE
jgi:hypothetical protein